MSPESHLVVGAGPIGSRVAQLLLERGDSVLLATRRGTPLPGARAVVADAADAASLARAADGCRTIFVCASPAAYTAEAWQSEWPPIFRAAMHAANETRARLVVMGNLYPYGPVDGAMTEHTPENPATAKARVRHDGWQALKAATDAGELRAVEVRASDYFGAGARGTAHLGERFFAPVMASHAAQVVGDPAVPHSWSYLDDIARTLVAAAHYRGPWGRVWHVPSGIPHSRIEIAETLDEWFGAHGSAKGMPRWALRSAGLFSPQLRGVADEAWQFERPFVIDASETERMLGVAATPWETALRATAESYRAAH
ncbi:MAG: NAD-dependent epimerase/dehydratase family protein [Microbacteriaceae bacterium]|nr:NAD-dependent epimerase/dehydratase family protein [Microbacteriaceae bacterium]MCL2795477.1 NAD-dependent epimerase/dehydratase family protein [Microbacteriaceae bacterium]